MSAIRPLPTVVSGDTGFSYSHRFIWLCIPKVASRSMIKAFRAMPNVDFKLPKEVISHPTPKAYFALLSEKGDHFRFALVRNPWCRVASFYVEKLQHYDGSVGKQKMMKSFPSLSTSMSFEELVEWLSSSEGSDSNADHHWKPQHKFVCDENGDLVVDYIGRLESVKDDFTAICEELCLPTVRLPIINDNRRRVAAKDMTEHYRSMFSPALVNAIGDRYARDIELFGYDF